jgi:predicted Zn-dependent protease
MRTPSNLLAHKQVKPTANLATLLCIGLSLSLTTFNRAEAINSSLSQQPILPVQKSQVVPKIGEGRPILLARNIYSSRESIRRLEEADRFYTQGNLVAAEKIYREVKPAFNSSDIGLKPITDPQQLSGAPKVYWREAEGGMKSKFEVKSLTSLRLLTENYPEFIPGHIKYAEALQIWKQPEKSSHPKPVEVLERGTSLYPDRTDLLEAKVAAIITTDTISSPLEASIALRQFAITYPDHPDSAKYRKQADDYLNEFRAEMQKQQMVGALFGDSRSVLQMKLGESAFGKLLADQRKQKVALIDDPVIVNYVNTIGQKLARRMGRDEFEYEFYVVKDDAIDARAYPGGKIFINTGAIEASTSEAVLAGLIAHEISHSVLSHGLLKEVEAAKGSLFKGLIGILGEDIYDGLLLGVSRGNERQADILGTRVLAGAGYAADGLHSLMLILRERGGNAPTKWLDSHPAPIERVRYLEEMITRNGYNRYAYEGVESHNKIRNRLKQILAGQTPSDKEDSTPPEQDDSKVAASTVNPSSTSVTGQQTLTVGQTKKDIVVKLDGVYVSSNSFRANLVIENNSSDTFTFVPGFAKVLNTSSGAKLKSALNIKSGSVSVSPGGATKAELVVFGHHWNGSGKQELLLELKEGSVGVRVFRLAF